MRQPLKIISRLCIFGAALLVAGCDSSSDGGANTPTPLPERISFAGVGANGIFDPSIARDPVSGQLWMSYSAVDPSPMWSAEIADTDAIATRLAYSDDNGKTWTDSGAIVNNFLDVNFNPPLLSPYDAGTWVNEVSQLIYDPNAIDAEKWKILWHHYLVLNRLPVDERRLFEHGWIAMKMAATPQELATAPEIKLFAGTIYNTDNNVTGTPLLQLDTLNLALKDCAVFTGPGMITEAGALYVSLQCEAFDLTVSPPTRLNRLIVLLKCAGNTSAGGSCGNAANWSYRGTVLQRSDADAFGFDDGFGDSGLFAAAGGMYLVVTPVQNVGAPWPAYYNGCRVFKFADIDSALLQKTGAQPTLIAAVNGTAGSFNGACAYHASASNSGMLYSELKTTVTDRFQIFMSHTNF